MFQGWRKTFAMLLEEFDSLTVHMANKTKTSSFMVFIVVGAIVTFLFVSFGAGFFNGEYRSPVFGGNDKKDDGNVTVEYKSWTTQSRLTRPITVIYRPGLPGDGGVSSYYDFHEWYVSNRVKRGTPVFIRAITGVTVKFIYVRLKVDGKTVCEKHMSFGNVECSVVAN